MKDKSRTIPLRNWQQTTRKLFLLLLQAAKDKKIFTRNIRVSAIGGSNEGQ